MQYAKESYGAQQYGSIEVNNLPVEPVDLMAYLPDFWQLFSEMKAIQETLGAEAGLLRANSTGLLEQFFLDTATWGLSHWEHAFGVATDETKSNAFRRAQLWAKIRGAGTTTKQMLIQLAASFSGGEVTVLEFPKERRFVVKFVGIKGIPPNLAGLEQAIEQVKPAHLAFSFAYTYTFWNQMLDKKWNHLTELTWIQANTI